MSEPSRKPWWRSVLGVALALGAALLTVIGVVNDGAEFADFLGEQRPHIKDAADWLYPGPLVVTLGLIGIGTSIGWWVARKRCGALRGEVAAAKRVAQEAEDRCKALELERRPEEQAHDKRILTDLVEVLPRRDVEYWRGVDFGGVWSGDKTRVLDLLIQERSAVEHGFLNPELERLREVLMSAVRTLRKNTAYFGGPAEAGPGYFDIGDIRELTTDPVEIKKFEERRESRIVQLTNDADALVAAYDALLNEARRRLPEALANSGERTKR